MIYRPRQGLVPVRELTDLDRQEIEALAVVCKRYEGMDLPLYLGTWAGNETKLFLHYKHGATACLARGGHSR